MQGIAFVVRASAAGPALLPRRVDVDVEPGGPALRVEGRVDEACVASMAHAWAAARRVAGVEGLAARVRVAGAAPLVGGSAGLLVALLALSALSGRAEPPRCFATGTVVDDAGRLEGGAWAREKAEAAASLAADLGWAEPLFLSPPVEPPPLVPGVAFACAQDVAEAWRLCSRA